MRNRIVLICFLISGIRAYAGRIDQDVLNKISGTKWDLIEEKKAGGIIHKKNLHPSQLRLTFSTGSMLFDSEELHTQCDYTLKNANEFWMYCTEPDQYIYRVHALDSKKLEIDLLAKVPGGKYVRKKRMFFKRIKQ